MSAFLDKLSQFLDVKTGMKYSMELEEVYSEILNAYVEDSKEEQIVNHFEAQDWEGYRINAHSLKSTSMTIGAVEFSEFAKSIELACKEENYDYVKSTYEKFISDYKTLLEKIKESVE